MKLKHRNAVHALSLMGVLLLLIPVLSGCNVPAELHISGETMVLDPEAEFDYKSYYEKLSLIAAPESEAIPENTTVYWVAGGEVWHMSETCTSLSRSKEINSGSVSLATENGKTRACSKCSK